MRQDREYMLAAIEQARNGMFSTTPNPRVGCVLVSNGCIVAEGFHHRAGEPHAEIEAIKKIPLGFEGEITAYVTLEPCCHQGKTPPCTQALINLGVKKVVVGMLDPNPLVAGKGILALQRAGIEVIHGVCEAEAKSLNRGFAQKMLTGMPLITGKAAISLDGNMGLVSGESKWITGSQARADVMRMRAKNCAIITGIQTILVDDPALNVRDFQSPIEVKQPDLIILDSSLRIPLNAQVLSTQEYRKVTIVCVNSASSESKIVELSKLGVAVQAVEGNMGRVTLDEVQELLSLTDYNEVMIESGSTLLSECIKDGFLNELVVYQAPILIGSDGVSIFGERLDGLHESTKLGMTNFTQIGQDLKITYSLADCEAN